MPFLGGRGQASRGYFGGGTTPDAPTSLSSTAGDQQLFVAFTAPVFTGGLTITNYEYAVSSNGGSTYGTWTALSPSDTTSPVTIPGLTNGTAYYIKLRAVNSLGSGTESSPVSTNTTPFGNPVATTGSGSDTTTTPTAPTTNSPTSTQSFGTQVNLTYTSGSGTWTNPYPSGASTGTGTLNGSSGTTSFIWGTSSGSYPNEVAATSNAYVRTTWPRGTTVFYKAKITNTSCALQFNGTVNANGASTTVTFEYGTTSGVYPSSVTAAQSPATGASNTSVSATLSSLSAGTYYFRVKAVNARGTTFGSEQSVAISAKSSTAASEQSFTPPAVTTISDLLVVGGGGATFGPGAGGGGVSFSSSKSAPSSVSYSVGGPGTGNFYPAVTSGTGSSLTGTGISMSATGGGPSLFEDGVNLGGTSGTGSGGSTFNSAANPGGSSGNTDDVDFAYGGGGGAGGAGGSYYLHPVFFKAAGGNGGAAVTYGGITVSSGGGGQDMYPEGSGGDLSGITPFSSYGGGAAYNRGPQGGVVRFHYFGP
jgi:Fibronectin type III domain